MARPRKNPDEVLLAATAMVKPVFLAELDKAAGRLRMSRSQFCSLLLERGFAAYQKDGIPFVPEDEFVIEEIVKKKKKT
jgi:hypothetical protein